MREFSTAFVVSGTVVATECGRLTHRNKTPATNEGSKQLATTDIDVARTERHEIVGCADRVGRDVDTECDNDQANGAESGSSSTTMGS